MLGRLKASEITKLGPGRHHDGGGLYLVVGKGNARSWIFRYFRDGKSHDFGLGPAHTLGLADARERAFECKAALYRGNNPVRMRQAEREERVLAVAKAMTFEQAAGQYIAAHKAKWRGDRQERQWRQSLAAYVFPILGKLPVRVIDTELVVKVLEPIWFTKTETATRIRNRIELILDWATARGYREGDNPARWRGHLKSQFPERGQLQKTVHHAALPFAEIGTFMTELRRLDDVPARALELLTLTALRTDEVRLAQWNEINRAERVWTVPAERMKGKQPHRVPLSDAALQVFDAMEAMKAGRFVFPGRNGAFGPAEMRRILGSLRAGLTVHGLRSTFRDWAKEAAYPDDVAEKALAHQVAKNQSEAAYLRTDLLERRRPLMNDWAQRCAGGAVVLPFEPIRAVE
jgi:integrase